MPPIPGYWHSLITRHAKDLKAAVHKVSKAIDAQISGQSQARLEKVLVRNTPKQPVHPIARIRQTQSRWFSTARQSVRSFANSAGHSGSKYDRASFPKSRVSSYISQSSGRAPFASTLRPNLTGGTLGRTAGGYALGGGKLGGARYFSHGPASQAQVVQNVSQALRAFLTQGNKAQFDGHNPHTGDKKFKAVTATQNEANRRMREVPKATPGSWIEFQINPTITALTPLNAVAGFTSSSYASHEDSHLNTSGLLDCLSADFSRALKDLAVVLNDLQRLGSLGDLPITCEGTTLKVHFPGCDADTVNVICDELNVRRGTVFQDDKFDAFTGTEIALLFPFAPSKGVSQQSSCDSLYEHATARDHKMAAYQPQLVRLDDLISLPEDAAYSTASALSDSDPEDVVLSENPWLSSLRSAYQSIRSGSDYSSENDPLEYQGFEGIYKFIEQCDSARRR